MVYLIMKYKNYQSFKNFFNQKWKKKIVFMELFIDFKYKMIIKVYSIDI